MKVRILLINRKVKVLFLGIGSAEGSGTKTFSDQLTQAGINNIYYESPGTAHEVADVAPLFQGVRAAGFR